MGALSEVEIFSCLKENFRLAAEKCELLAWHPRRGYVYNEFRQSLELAEGACRQAAAHREDSVWLTIGLAVADVGKRTGYWLRRARSKEERKMAHPLFGKLAEILRALERKAERRRTEATGRIGIILPDELPGPHRDTRPVAVKLPSGLIVPASYH